MINTAVWNQVFFHSCAITVHNLVLSSSYSKIGRWLLNCIFFRPVFFMSLSFTLAPPIHAETPRLFSIQESTRSVRLFHQSNMTIATIYRPVASSINSLIHTSFMASQRDSVYLFRDEMSSTTPWVAVRILCNSSWIWTRRNMSVFSKLPGIVWTC